MEFLGDYRFAATALEVWIALNDPEVLKRTIPGCETMVRISATEYAGHVSVKLGPLNAGFEGKITLSELDPPASYRISVEAEGTIAGRAAGSARVRLEDVPGGSIIHYQAETEFGGRLATIGAKFVRGTATRYADKFFARFAQAMAERSAAAAIAPPPP